MKTILILIAAAFVALPAAFARILNVSTRVMALPGDPPVIEGIVVSDVAGPARVLFRGIGQGLYNVPGIPRALPCMTAPRLELHGPSGAIVAVSSPVSQLSPQDQLAVGIDQARVGAAPIMAASDAVIDIVVPPGAYTVIMSDPTGGLGLVEAYVVTGTSRFLDISTRGPTHQEYAVGAMIVGFVIDCQTNVLVRNVGPSLAKFGVPDPIQDPAFTLYTGGGSAVWVPPGFVQTPSGPVTATAWGNSPLLALGAMTAAARSGAFPLDIGSNDAAISFTLPAGAWTVVGTHASIVPTNGTCMIEAYDAGAGG